ncbi:MAG: hypothetical protein QXR60_04745 [Candidatus Nanoarchaeia archaeon]
MKSCTQLLNGWINNGKESLLRNIKTAEDVEALRPRLESMAQNGIIDLDGYRLDVDKAMRMLREYIGKELHSNYKVMRANGLYVAS